MRKYKCKATVLADGNLLIMRENNYTELTTPKRSYMNRALKLQPGDIVTILVTIK